jgi:hypothetical protein
MAGSAASRRAGYRMVPKDDLTIDGATERPDGSGDDLGIHEVSNDDVTKRVQYLNRDR